MTTMLSRLALAATLLLATGVVGAPDTPEVVYPLGIQRPPVARVGSPFTWSFLPGTFNCSAGTATLSYTVTGLPSWASFSASTNTFSGTPPSGAAVGTARVVVSAVSTVDGEASAPATDDWGLLLVPASWKAPVWQAPLSEQLASGAVLGSATAVRANDGGISVPPQWSWSLGLVWDTVTSPVGAQIFYTAYEEGTTSLPYWLDFNPSTVTFDGITPPEEGQYTIVLLASDHRGYGDLSQTFTFAVSQHTFDLTSPLPAINATAGGNVSYVVPTDSLTVDGSPANADQIAGVTVDVSAASFLSYDAPSRTISGQVPSNVGSLSNVSLPVTFQFTVNGSFTTSVGLSVVESPFSVVSLPSLVVQPGAVFDLDLSGYFNDSTTTYSLATVVPSNSTSWIHFTSNPAALTGTAPSAATVYDNSNVTFNAVQNGAVVDAAHLSVYIGSDPTQPQSSGTTPGNDPPPGNGGDSSGSGRLNGGSHGLSSRGKLILIAILCSVFGILLLIFLAICCRRYCETNDEDEEYVDAIERKSPAATPNSFATTFVGDGTPKWKQEEDIKVSAMLAAQQGDLGDNGMPDPASSIGHAAMMGGEPEPEPAPRRFDMFNIFHGRVDPPGPGPATHPSLQGLGIASTASQQRVDAARMADEERAIRGAAGAVRSADDSGHEAGQASVSDGHRSSWNTSGSSSLFYSDTPADDSEAFDGKSVSRSVSASIPRRRADFRVPSGSKRSGAAPSAESPDRSRGIRLVQNTPNRPSRDSAAMDPSESLGAIATAAILKVTPPRLPGESDPSARPKLVPFNRHQSGPAPTAASHPHRSSAVIHGMTQSPEKGVMQVESEAGENRFSAYSGLYPPTESAGSPPTASPIFFSTPREDGWRSPTMRSPATDTGAFDQPEGLRLLDSTTPAHSPDPRTFGEVDSASNKTLTPSKTNQSNWSAFQDAAVHVKVAVGEPFHFTPSLTRPPLPGSPDPNAGGAPRSQYVALWDDDLKRQLPEWVHFDARDIELWGIPTKADAGRIPIRIVERRIVTFPGSPGGGRVRSGDVGAGGTPLIGYQDDVDEVVSRFVVEVVDHPSLGGNRGDVQVITF